MGYNPEKLNILGRITDKEAYLSEGLYGIFFPAQTGRRLFLQENIVREFIGQSIITPTKDIDMRLITGIIPYKKIELKATPVIAAFCAFFKSIGLPGDITVKQA